jgi:hypothetical protein
MKIDAENVANTGGDQQEPSVLRPLYKCYEYWLIAIPPIGLTLLDGITRRRGKISFLSNGTIFTFLIALPVVACLYIMRLKYRDLGAAILGRHYRRAGFWLPIFFLSCLFVSTLVGWTPDDGAMGWFIIMALPAAYLFSLITLCLGKVISLICK